MNSPHHPTPQKQSDGGEISTYHPAQTHTQKRTARRGADMRCFSLQTARLVDYVMSSRVLILHEASTVAPLIFHGALGSRTRYPAFPDKNYFRMQA